MYTMFHPFGELTQCSCYYSYVSHSRRAATPADANFFRLRFKQIRTEYVLAGIDDTGHLPNVLVVLGNVFPDLSGIDHHYLGEPADLGYFSKEFEVRQVAIAGAGVGNKQGIVKLVNDRQAAPRHHFFQERRAQQRSLTIDEHCVEPFEISE